MVAKIFQKLSNFGFYGYLPRNSNKLSFFEFSNSAYFGETDSFFDLLSIRFHYSTNGIQMISICQFFL